MSKRETKKILFAELLEACRHVIGDDDPDAVFAAAKNENTAREIRRIHAELAAPRIAAMSELSRKYCGALQWRWLSVAGEYFSDVGIRTDGTLHNRHGYPEARLYPALLRAVARSAREHRESIAGGVAKRRGRRETRIAQAVEAHLAGRGIGNLHSCFVCGKLLTDPKSIARGIGPECLESIIRWAERKREREAAP